MGKLHLVIGVWVPRKWCCLWKKEKIYPVYHFKENKGTGLIINPTHRDNFKGGPKITCLMRSEDAEAMRMYLVHDAKVLSEALDPTSGSRASSYPSISSASRSHTGTVRARRIRSVKDPSKESWSTDADGTSTGESTELIQ